MPSTLTPQDQLLVDAIAARIGELWNAQPSRCGLVDAATLADVLGVARSYIYAHADALEAVRIGSGTKPRLRFDLEAAREAFTCYVSKQSQSSNTSAGAESETSAARRRRRLPNGLPEPGAVLAVRPRSGP